MRAWIATPAGEIGAAVLLGVVLFLPFLGSHDLWAPNEPNHAEVAREMLASGTWSVPHLLGEVYPGKPPLLHWSIALLARGIGMNEWSVRLPSTLSALALLGLVVRLGQILFPGTRAGLAAGIVLATMTRFLWQARFAEPDMLRAACVAGAILGWIGLRDAGWRWFPIPALAVAGAILAKGPVAFVFLLSIVIPGVFLLPGGRRLRGAILFAGALALGVGLVALWLLVAIRNGYPLEEILRKQVVERTESGLHHLQPWYYYLWNLPADALPWTFLAPWALFRLLRQPGDPRVRLWLVAWVLLPLFLFSLSPEKRGVYLLPVLPAVALLAGAALEPLIRPGADRPSRFVAVSAISAASLGAVLALAVPPLLPMADLRGKSLRPLAEEAVGHAAGRPLGLRPGREAPALAFYTGLVAGDRLRFLPSKEDTARFLREEAPCLALVPGREAGPLLSRSGGRARAILLRSPNRKDWALLESPPLTP